ncbi:MAG: hypothetical protein N2167_11820, partial [Flavobacteriales bacterium]|nr:hypothetical protein [Flavobacteriales bacterium]
MHPYYFMDIAITTSYNYLYYVFNDVTCILIIMDITITTRKWENLGFEKANLHPYYYGYNHYNSTKKNGHLHLFILHPYYYGYN